MIFIIRLHTTILVLYNGLLRHLETQLAQICWGIYILCIISVDCTSTSSSCSRIWSSSVLRSPPAPRCWCQLENCGRMDSNALCCPIWQDILCWSSDQVNYFFWEFMKVQVLAWASNYLKFKFWGRLVCDASVMLKI